MLFVLLSVIVYKCGHAGFQKKLDEELKRRALSSEDMVKVTYKSRSKEKTQPIRIHFDYTFLNGADPHRCTKVGEKKSWGNVVEAECTKEDIITDEKIKIIKGVAEEVSKYFRKLVKVVPLASLTPRSQGSNPASTETLYDTDLYVALYGRPMGFGGPAGSTGSLFGDDSDPRPKMVFMSLRLSIMDHICNITSTDRKPFELLVHEMMHGLGISSGKFDRWINPDTGRTYYADRISNTHQCYFPEDGIKRKFLILSTPTLRKFVYDRYGDKDFGPNCPAGIELEDDGGDGSMYTHPECRAFPNDNMIAAPASGSQISELSLALLNATGYYDVDFSLAEPLTFGLPVTNNDKPMNRFTIGVPQKVWPQKYLCEPYTGGRKCTPDRKGRAQCTRMPHNCPNFRAEVCNDLNFFDPFHKGFVGSDHFADWVNTPWNGRECTYQSDGFFDETFRGATPGKDALCFESSITSKKDDLDIYRAICYRIECKDDYAIVHVNNMTAECHKEGQIISFPNSHLPYGNLVCPEPKNLCKLKDLPGKPDFNKILNE